MFTHLSTLTLQYAFTASLACCTMLLVTCGYLWRKNQRLSAQYETERGIDPLTGTWNRIRFMELAERQINHVQRTGRSAAALIVDLDHCMKINEQYGHNGGDMAVQYLARCAQATVRDYDLLSRYSGEELAMILPDTTIEGALSVAQRLRDRIADQEVVLGNNTRFGITVTIGISALSSETHTLEDILLAADSALANAKSQGHNKTATLPL